jgi:hypothetical protein
MVSSSLSFIRTLLCYFQFIIVLYNFILPLYFKIKKYLSLNSKHQNQVFYKLVATKGFLLQSMQDSDS